MRLSDIAKLENRIRTALAAANWEGKFTTEIRDATKAFRIQNLHKPLTDALEVLERDKARRNRQRTKRRFGSDAKARAAHDIDEDET